MRLLIASDNAKKRAELERLLAPLGCELVTPGDLGGLPAVDEDRPTFAGNAAKKARSGALASGLWSLADDSGLEVEALDAEPGVRSARFAGRHGDDAANNALLLERLAGPPPQRRGARFVCAPALVGRPRRRSPGHRARRRLHDLRRRALPFPSPPRPGRGAHGGRDRARDVAADPRGETRVLFPG